MIKSEEEYNAIDPLLSIPKVAKLFDVKPDTIRRWIRQGDLPAQKIGKGHYWRVRESDVIELAERKYGERRDDKS